MNADNRHHNAAHELGRADTCLEEARTLAAGLPFGAASRAYYAVVHAARALLFSIGIEVRTQKGVVTTLGEHFVRPGRLSPALGRLVSRMQRHREDADYATGAVFTGDEAAEMITDAEAFVAEARRLITAGNG